MKIRQIKAYRAKSIHYLNHSLYDEWLGEVMDALMIIGPNGAGKSTLLEGIAALWEEWGNWLDAAARKELIPVGSRRKSGEPANLPKRCALFAQPNFGLLAMELVDLDPERSIWLAAGGEDEIAELHQQNPDAYIVAAVGQRSGELQLLENWGLDWPGGPKDLSWLSRWGERRQRSLLEIEELPNLLYFEPDNRQLLPPQDNLDITKDLQDPVVFNWIARYAPQTRRAGHLNSMLYRMQITDPKALKTIFSDINTYLKTKQIEGFSALGDLEVEIGTASERTIKHLVYGLSSGERQVFIFVAMLRRWLRPGGLVLIDEPELHLHPSWRETLFDWLRQLVRERSGQLIITSQSARLWKQLERDSERIELGEQSEVRE